MKREFTINIIFLLAINLLVKPFYALIIDTTVQNRVGPETYGIYLALFNFVYIQQIFADLGLQNFNNTNISKNPHILKNILPKVLGTKLFFTLAFGILVLCSSFIIGYGSYVLTLLPWIIGSMACLSFILYARTNISGVGKYMIDSAFSVLDKVLLIGILAYYLWIDNSYNDHFDIMLFVKVQFFSLIITLIAVLTYTHLKIERVRFNFDIQFTAQLIRSSLPYATLVLLMAGYSRIDGIMLERMINDQGLEAGKYASAFRLYDTWNGFTFLFAVLLLPMFSRLLNKNEKIRELEQWSSTLLLTGGIFIFLFVYFYNYQILDLFYNRTIDESYTNSLVLLIAAGLPLSMNYIYGTLLTANGNLRLLNTIALGGFLTNLILNIIAIPRFGASGAALTTLITQLLVFLLQYYSSRRIFELHISILKIIKIIVITVFLYFAFKLGLEYWETEWYYQGLIYGFLYVLLALLLKLIRIEDLRINLKTP